MQHNLLTHTCKTNREIKIHVYAKLQTWICTTWPSFSPYFPFTVYCFYTKISSFMPALSIRIALDCFYLLIFYSEKFSTDVCRLPYAVNVNLNLSNVNLFSSKVVNNSTCTKTWNMFYHTRDLARKVRYFSSVCSKQNLGIMNLPLLSFLLFRQEETQLTF